MSKNFLFVFVLLFIVNLSAQKTNVKPVYDECDNTFEPTIPLVDYYASVYKLSGISLKTALHNLIKGHSTVSYASLWTHFQTTDKKPNGKVWDIYSDVPNGTPPYEYIFVTNQCGNYSGEGSCYNREHSWCQSWFGDQTNAPYSDLFHLYPTDGYVNGRRSNYNFGDVGTATWTSLNGSKLGSSATPGFSGTVFEPINAYKGDLARSAFYMSVRYYTEDGAWGSSDGTNKSEILTWYANLLYKWHMNDSVSAKEINRNTAIYGIQGNRNPFIDHPEFAAEIWQTASAPLVVSIQLQSRTSIILDFSRYLDSSISVNTTNFILSNGVGSPVQIQWGINSDISKLNLVTPQLAGGTTYTLQVRNLKSINSVTMSDTVLTFTTDGTTNTNEKDPSSVSSMQLEQNYPNPFNPSTSIRFNLPEAGNITLKIYDALGKEIAVLADGYMAEGNHTINWNADGLTSGLYVYRLTSGSNYISKKLMLLK